MGLIIDEEYLEKVNDKKTRYVTLDSDLATAVEVELIRPESSGLHSLYLDVLSYVCYKCILVGYVIKVQTSSDAEKIRANLGNNIEGDLENGYRFNSQSRSQSVKTNPR